MSKLPVDMILYFIAAYLLFSAIIRLSIQYIRQKKKEIVPISKYHIAKAVLHIIGSILMLFTLYIFSRMVLSRNLYYPIATIWKAGILGTLIDTFGMLRSPKSFPNRKFIMLLPQSGILIVSIILVSYVIYLRSVPGEIEPIHLDYPVRKDWFVEAGGRTALTNYHNISGNPLRNIFSHQNTRPAEKTHSQQYAIDLMRVGDNNKSFGEPIFSPSDGVIIQAIDGYDNGSPEDNHIIIRTSSGISILIGHLKRGSVLVKKGETVSTRAKIAECGKSGSAIYPHLHIHAQNGNKPVPILMGKRNKYLIRGDIINPD